MLVNRLAALSVVCIALPMAGLGPAWADPPPAPGPGAAPEDADAPDTGVVASADPAVVTTPDGWTLTVAATNESQLPIAALTTATTSREYLAGGTFTGTATGNGTTKLNGGTLEAGYQIGCGIELGQVRLVGSVGVNASASLANVIPTGISIPLKGEIDIHPKPGKVLNIPVDKKKYKAAPVRITLKDIHIKVDGCVGQSFLRSYATLTSSSTSADDVVAYYGVTKSV